MIDEHAVRGVLDFWFGPPDSPDFEAGRAVWFESDPAFDSEVRRRLGGLHEQAARYRFHHWREHPPGCIALTLLLDQVPRNLFRGTARAFATDPYARAVSRHARERRFDTELPTLMRLFLYLPLEHSENLHDQETYIRLVRGLNDPGFATYGLKHRDIIARFGRFPHRNKALGRKNTPAEAAYLAGAGDSFGQ